MFAGRGGASRSEIVPTAFVARVHLRRSLGIRVAIFLLLVAHPIPIFSGHLNSRERFSGAIFSIALQLISVRRSIYVLRARGIIGFTNTRYIMRLSVECRILIYFKFLLLYRQLLTLGNLGVPLHLPVQISLFKAFCLVLLFHLLGFGSVFLSASPRF